MVQLNLPLILTNCVSKICLNVILSSLTLVFHVDVSFRVPVTVSPLVDNVVARLLQFQIFVLTGGMTKDI